MKQSSLIMNFLLAALLLLSAVPSFAASTWTALGETGTITNVQVTRNASTYDITMLLSSAATAGNTYSVYLSPTADVFDSYTQDVSAATSLNKKKVLTAYFGLNDYTFSADGVSKQVTGSLSTDKTTLSWQVAKSDVINNFWFAGEVTNSTTGDSLSKTKVAATPIPGAVWLLGSGILGLVGLRRRQTV